MLQKITAFLPVFFFWGCFFVATAQETKIYTHDQKQYQDALALYNNEQYQAAQSIFAKVKEDTDNLETPGQQRLLRGQLPRFRLNQLGADRLMESFVENYPTSTKRNSAFVDVAEYYFETGKYPYALKWYNKVDQNSLSRGGNGQVQLQLRLFPFLLREAEGRGKLFAEGRKHGEIRLPSQILPRLHRLPTG